MTAPRSPRTPSAPSPGALHVIRGLVLGSAALAMGLISGFFYAYACSVMVGLARVDDHTFIDTMQWINATVRNRWFAPAFFGALVLTALAVLLHLPRGRRRVLPWAVAALALYATAFGITMGVNVPLNEELAAAGDPALIGDPAAVRAAFEAPWAAWNTTRTVASTAALGCLLRALALHGRASHPDAPATSEPSRPLRR
ncbi:anthrone oxygenase family protein [Nocardiopsis lambiniae]|uniref:Anthrone oxygenase family protein n=1 Tax=Nocardiopsis lambiniae TaxID=3075539 RepID=A0ABU2M545_9ACTN|nr:anthrone oxygenase family protein [Nocardiopsis sp. DSM 44743]MDT0327446.1 anthrone oxygenase family protein [Nocardiopsis sp. DSM 44743]